MMQAALAAVCVFVCGCGPAQPEDDGPPKPQQVDFVGTINPDLVGNWTTANGRSAFDLRKDGSATILTVTATPGGDHRDTLKGSWLTSDKNLLLRYVREGQTNAVVRYGFVLSGSNLTLIQSGGRMKTEYVRK